MAQNLRDKGYSSSMDGYNQQKKKEQQVSTQRASTQKGPITQAREEKFHARQTETKQGTAQLLPRVSQTAPIQTQRISTVPYDRAAPASGKVTEDMFNHSLMLKNSFGTYRNYLDGRRVTSSGFSRRDDAVDDMKSDELNGIISRLNIYSKAQDAILGNLKEKRDAFSRADEAYKKAYQGGTLRPDQEVARARAYTELEQFWGKAQKFFGDYETLASEYQTKKSSYDEDYNQWLSTVRGTAEIRKDIAAKQAEIDELNMRYAALSAESANAATNMMHGITPPASALSTAMNNAEERRRIELKLENMRGDLEELNGELEVSTLQEWQRYAEEIPVSARRTYGGKDLLEQDAEHQAEFDKIVERAKETGRASGGRRWAGKELSLMDTDVGMSREMTQAEKETYQAIRRNYGPKKAQEYFDWLRNTSLNSRRRAMIEESMRSIVEDDPIGIATIGANALSVILKPLEAASFLGQTAEMIRTGNLTKDAQYNKASWMIEAIRGATEQKISAGIDSKTSGKVLGKTWGELGSFAYQTGMSIADFLYGAHLTGAGGPGASKAAREFSLMLMGTEAAADGTIRAMDRGLTGRQAYALGLASGLAEYVTEKISLETLLDMVKASGGVKEKAWYLLKNRLAESSEEGASDFLNLFADIVVSKDQSEWRKAIREYQKQGMSEKDAFGRAFCDQMEETKWSMLGGWISGAVMSDVELAMNEYQNNHYLKSTSAETDKVQKLIDAGNLNPEDSRAFKAAQDLQAKMEAGEDVSLKEAMKAANTINRALDRDLKSASAEAIGRHFRTDREVMEDSVSYLLATRKNSKAYNLGMEIYSKLQNGGEITAKEAGEAILQAAQVRSGETGVRPVRDLQPREVTEDMDDLDRTAAVIGVSEKEVARVRRFADAIGITDRVRYYSKDPENGRVENGKHSGGKIYINAQGVDPILQVVSHELTHLMEETEAYKKFAPLILDRIENYEEEKARLTKLYDDGTDIDAELVAFYVQENLLQNERAVKEMVRQSPALVQWLLDQVDGFLAKLGNENAKERAFLRKVSNLYMEALREANENKNTAAESQRGGVQMSFSEAEDYSSAAEQMETISDEDYLEAKKTAPFIHVMDHTPAALLVDSDTFKDRPMIIRRDALYLAIRQNGVQEGNYHHLGADIMKHLPDYLSSPDVILQTENGRRAALVSMPTKTGQGIISVEFETVKDFGGHYDYYNLVVTAFDLKQRYLRNLFLRQGAYVVDMKEDLAQVNPKLHEWLGIVNAKSSDDMVAQQEPEVKDLSLPAVGDAQAEAAGSTEGPKNLSLPKVDDGEQQFSMSEVVEEAGTLDLSLPKIEAEDGAEITVADVTALRNLSSRHIAELTSDELQRLTPWARKFRRELKEKSPFFRAWFGDWRSADSSSVNVPTVQSNTIRKAEAGKIKNDDTGKMISWGDQVFRESWNHAGKQSVAPYVLGNIRQIAKSAVLLDSEISEPNSKSKMENTAFMHSFYALCNYNGNLHLLKLYAEEALDNRGKDVFTRAYEIKDIKEIASAAEGVLSKGGLTQATNAKSGYSVADLYALVKQYDRDFKARPSSKIVNEDGTPKVMYRGDMEDFTVFDRKKSRPSNLYGRGFYFTDSESHAKQYGKARAFYLDVKQPLSPGQHQITRGQMRAFLEAVAENEDDYDLQNYGYGATVDSVLREVYGKGDFEMIQDVSATAIGDLVEAVELFNEINGTDYDGIVTDTETVTFRSEQAKSATDNVGTFDRNNPDIRYSYSETEDGPIGLSLPMVEAAEQEGTDTEASEVKGLELPRVVDERTQRRIDTVRKAVETVEELTDEDRASIENVFSTEGQTGSEALQDSTQPTRARRWLNKTLQETFHAPEGQKTRYAEIIGEYTERAIRNKRLSEEDVQELTARLFGMGEVQVPADEYHRTMREWVKNHRVYVSDEIKAEFEDDYDLWRRRAFAAGVYFVNDSRAIHPDSWNVELSEMFPGQFHADTTDMRTVLEQIVTTAEEGRTQKMSLPEYLYQQEQVEGADGDKAYYELLGKTERAMETFAEMAGLEMDMKEQRFISELQQKTLKQLQWAKRNAEQGPQILRAAAEKLVGDFDILAAHAAKETRYAKKYGATYRDLGEMLKKAMGPDPEHPQFFPSQDLQNYVARVEGEHIEDMDVDDLYDLWRALVAFRTEFENRKSALMGADRVLFEDIYHEAARDMRRARGSYSRSNLLKSLNNEMLSPINVLARMGGWNRRGMWFQMARQLEQGEMRKRAHIERARQEVDEFAKKNRKWIETADGQGRNGQWIPVEFHEMTRRGENFEPIFGDTVRVWMTPMQRIHMYLESKNKQNMLHMEGGRTFVKKDLYQKGDLREAFAQASKDTPKGADYGTFKLAPETVYEIISQMTPKEMELAKILEKYYNAQWVRDEINQTSNYLIGLNKSIGGYYAPIYTNQNYVSGEIGMFDTTSAGQGNMKTRVWSLTPSYNISAMEAFERSIEQTGQYVGLAIAERNWNMLLNMATSEERESMKGLITGKWGEEGLNYVTELIKRLQGNKLAPEMKRGEILFEKLLSHFIGAKFGFNWGVAAKQTASRPMAAAILGWDTWARADKAVKVDMKIVNTYTKELAYRARGFSSPETAMLAKNPGIIQSNPALRFFFGGGTVTATDAATIRTLWPWAENYVKKYYPELEKGTEAQVKAGESPYYQKVAEVFNEAVANTQPMYDEMHRANIMKNSRGLQRYFTMFKTVPLQMYNANRQAWGEWSYARQAFRENQTDENRAEYRRAAKKVADTTVATVVSNLMLEGIAALAAGWTNRAKRYRDDEGELTVQSFLKRYGMNIAEDTAGMVIYGKEALQLLVATSDAIYAKLTGKKQSTKWYDIQTPGEEQINDLINSTKGAAEKIFDFCAALAEVKKEGEDTGLWLKHHAREYAGAAKDLIEKLGKYLGGLPMENLEKYVMGAVNFSPELTQALENAFGYTDRSKLKGKTGAQLERGVEDLFDLRGVQLSGESARAISDLFEGGVRDAVPQDVPDELTIDGEKVKLNEGQKQRWERTWAETVRSVNELVASKDYQNADEETRCRMLNKLYELAKIEANMTVPGWTTDEKLPEKAGEIINAGGTAAQAAAWFGLANNASDAEKFGALADMNISEDLKEAIFRTEKGAELETESGDMSAYGKLIAAKESGAEVSTYLRWLSDKGSKGDKSSGEKYEALADGQYTDAEKEALLPFVTDVKTEDGVQAVKEDWQYAKNRGLKIDTYLRWKSSAAGLTKDEERFAALAESDMSDTEKVAIAGTLFSNRERTGKNGDLTNYGQMMEWLNDGVPIDDYLTARANDALTEYGKTAKVGLPAEDRVAAAVAAHTCKEQTLEQKPDAEWWDFVLAARTSDNETKVKVGMMAALMDESDFLKWKACWSFVGAGEYALAKAQHDAILDREEAETGKRPSTNQTNVKAALDLLDLPTESKAYLFQMFNKSWKTGKNPYSSSAGAVAYNALHADDASEEPEGLSLPYIP